MNQLYLDLKAQLRSAYSDLPGSTELRESIWQYWSAYVTWGLTHPLERQALSKLQVSGRITGATRALAAQTFQDLIDLLMKARELGGLRNQPPALVGALLVAMAETAIDFISIDPAIAENTCMDTFSAFWSAITTG